nr:DUF6055 domain-containing protein [Cellulomonas sp. JZ18]
MGARARVRRGRDPAGRRGARRGLGGSDAASFRAASAAYLATLAVPAGHADVSDLLRAPHLAWGSARHGAAGWLLLDSLVARADPGLVADLWTQAHDGETVLGAYARLTGSRPEDVNRRVAQYAMRAAAGDGGGRAAATLLDDVDPVLLADRTTPTEPVPGDPAHHRVLGTFAPAAYGFTVVRLVPDGSGGDVRVRVRGHAEAFPAGAAGWSVGMVALGPEGPRFGPVTATVDGEVVLTPRAGEDAVLLVVTATPPEVPAGTGARSPARRATRTSSGWPVRWWPTPPRHRRSRAGTATPTAAAGSTTPPPSTRRPGSGRRRWSAARRRCAAPPGWRDARGSRTVRSSRTAPSSGTPPSSAAVRTCPATSWSAVTPSWPARARPACTRRSARTARAVRTSPAPT